MRKRIQGLLLLPLLFCFLPATALAGSGWVASLHAGQTDVDTVIRASGSWWSQMDDSDSQALAVALAHEFDERWAMRLMYQRATGIETRNRCPDGQLCPAVLLIDEADFHAWSLAVMPRWPVNEEWSLRGLAGFMVWELDVLERPDILRSSLPGGEGSELLVGVGLAWQPSPRYELSLEYERSGLDHRSLRLGLGLRFGQTGR